MRIAEIRSRAQSRLAGLVGTDRLGTDFAIAAFWSLAAMVMSQTSNLFCSVFAARMLGTVEFGQFSIIQNTLGMFGLFAGLALGITTTKYVAQFRASNPDRAGRVIALTTGAALISGGLVALVLAILAAFVSTNVLNAPELSRQLRIGALLLPLNAVSGVQSGVLAGFEDFKTMVSVNLKRGLIALPLTFIGVTLWSLTGAVCCLVLTAAMLLVLNEQAIRVLARRHAIRVQWRGCWTERPILWRFSLPALLGGILYTPAMWVAGAVLANQPNGYAEMGIFSAANQWRTAVAFFPAALCQPLLSRLSHALGGGDRLRFIAMLKANLVVTFGVSTSVAAVIALSGPWLLKSLFGSTYASGATVLAVLVFGASIDATAAVVGQALTSLQKMWVAFWLNLIWAVVLIAATIRFVPSRGALGLADAYLLSYLVHAATLGGYGWKQILAQRTATGGSAPLAVEASQVRIRA
jgi:O-antigen/teichoic acid export membrane protein